MTQDFERKECDQVSKCLKSAGIQSEPYHAGLSDKERNLVQKRWINEER